LPAPDGGPAKAKEWKGESRARTNLRLMLAEFTAVQCLWILGGGVLSGFLNTLASSGSAVSLPLLVFIGLHPATANATNRLGIVFGSLMSVMMFRREGLLPWKAALRICVWPWAGAVVGALAATKISDRATEWTIFGAVLLAFCMILKGAKSFLKPVVGEPRELRPRNALTLFLVGVWAGFIVLDSATFLLLAMVLGLNLSLRQANAYKSLALLGIAVLSVLVFWENSQLNLAAGGLLAAGNVVGAWAGTRCAVLKGADVWVYRLLVLVICLELIKLTYSLLT
jgi:uncharacterized membrane protein YfcA